MHALLPLGCEGYYKGTRHQKGCTHRCPVMGDGRFRSVLGMPNEYPCTGEGCECTRTVRYDRLQRHYYIMTKGACTHTTTDPGKWIFSEPHLEEHLRWLLLDKTYTPLSALAELQMTHRANKTVQRLKPRWVENFCE